METHSTLYQRKPQIRIFDIFGGRRWIHNRIFFGGYGYRGGYRCRGGYGCRGGYRYHGRYGYHGGYYTMADTDTIVVKYDQVLFKGVQTE